MISELVVPDLSGHRAPSRRFFNRDVLDLAKALIGAYLRHELPEGVVGGMIVEAEAYSQFNDPGCHAYKGLTNRNRAMFGDPGHAYTYFTYGNHWMFNVVAEKEGHGCAVLIRSVQPVEGIEIMRARRPRAKSDTDLCNGPGKLGQAFGIGREQYSADLTDSKLRILVPSPAHRRAILKKWGGIVQTARIGLGDGADLPYRFYLAEHPSVSVRRRNKGVCSD
jgi:DNA-3-methyladenine glycosylase